MSPSTDIHAETPIPAMPNPTTTMSELLAGIIGDTQTLIRQQFAMLRAEAASDLRKAADAGKVVYAGLALSGTGLLIISIGVVYLLQWLAPDLPLWACWMLVGGPVTVIGVIASSLGWRRLQAMTPIPEQSLKSLQENLSWIANHRK